MFQDGDAQLMHIVSYQISHSGSACVSQCRYRSVDGIYDGYMPRLCSTFTKNEQTEQSVYTSHAQEYFVQNGWLWHAMVQSRYLSP